MTLYEKATAFTEDNGLFHKPCRVIVGVSGGADSMCLLHVACRWRNRGISPIAVHVMHGIRGEEAQRDADFVRAQCAEMGVPLYIVRADVPYIAATARLGVEEVGRLIRYAVFERLRDETGSTYVLTAHTASDQAETVMMNILRGCGISGLCGIPSSRDHILRPLLQSDRTQVEEYCAQQGLSYVIDSTNADVGYTRNAIRHKVLPLLRELSSSADQALLRLSRNAGRDEAFLESVALSALNEAVVGECAYSTETFLTQHHAVRYRMLRLALENVGCHSMEERHFHTLSALLEQGSGAVDLPGFYSVRIEGERLRIVRDAGPFSPTEPIAIDSLPYSVEFGRYAVSLFICSADECNKLEKVHKLFFKSTIDYDTIQGGLQVRCRRAGDRMHPAGRGVGKSLKALMQENDIPAALRADFPLLCDETGIVLLPGYCCDERVRTGKHTNHFLVCLAERRST